MDISRMKTYLDYVPRERSVLMMGVDVWRRERWEGNVRWGGTSSVVLCKGGIARA